MSDYFTKILEDDLKAVVKPQYVDQIPRAVKGLDKSVESLISKNASMENKDEVLDVLGKDMTLFVAMAILRTYRIESHSGP